MLAGANGPPVSGSSPIVTGRWSCERTTSASSAVHERASSRAANRRADVTFVLAVLSMQVDTETASHPFLTTGASNDH